MLSARELSCNSCNTAALKVSAVSVIKRCFPEHTSNKEELMKLADVAMYKAKRAGGSHFCLYNNDLKKT